MKSALNTILTIATATVALCAVGAAVVIVRREFLQAPPPRSSRTPIPVAHWQIVAQRGNRLGPPDAPITITQFSDFQCPFCRRLYGTLKELVRANPNKVALVYRHFPVDRLHAHARRAAHASECVGRLGKFWSMHDVLYQKQDSLGILSWSELGRRAGATDSAGLASCMADSAIAARVLVDEDDAKNLEIKGTPMILINEWKFAGVPPMRVLDSVIKALLDRKSQ